MQAYLERVPAFRRFLDLTEALVDFELPLFRDTGRMRLHLAVGCTGGRHRSVAAAESLFRSLRDLGYDGALHHRDMDKESVG